MMQKHKTQNPTLKYLLAILVSYMGLLLCYLILSNLGSKLGPTTIVTTSQTDIKNAVFILIAVLFGIISIGIIFIKMELFKMRHILFYSSLVVGFHLMWYYFLVQ